jgi:hypothetical protein
VNIRKSSAKNIASNTVISSTSVWGWVHMKELITNITASISFQKNAIREKMLTVAVAVSESLIRDTAKIITNSINLNASVKKQTDKVLTLSNTTGISFTKGMAYFKELVADVVASSFVSRNVIFNKILTACVSAGAFVSKQTGKIFTSVVNTLSRMRRMWGDYKQLYPELSYTEYPIEMTVAEYPIEMTITEYPIELEVLGMPITGSTITLRGEFPDSAGNLTLLADVTVKIYKGGILLDTLSGAEITEVSTGIYTADYTIPSSSTGQYEYEFSGTIGSRTILDRSMFDAVRRG